MAQRSESNHSQERTEGPSHRVHLPGFITDEEVGLGDVVKRALGV
jgi:hypothetical protein